MSTYTVQSGDSLWSIALKTMGNGADWSQIASANHIASPYIIQPGQVLTIPAASAASASASVVQTHPATHVTVPASVVTPVSHASSTALSTTSSSSAVSSFFNIKYVLIGAAVIAAGYLLLAGKKKRKGGARPRRRLTHE
ncbi:MAG: LysM peptidoglycan-binding domain-containing protein [Rhodocyclaceae bacterium]